MNAKVFFGVALVTFIAGVGIGCTESAGMAYAIGIFQANAIHLVYHFWK